MDRDENSAHTQGNGVHRIHRYRNGDDIKIVLINGLALKVICYGKKMKRS